MWNIFFINLLTNITNNYILLLLIFLSIFLFIFNYNYHLIYILLKLFLLCIVNKNIIALNNILFIYHPYILYISFFFINFYFFFRVKKIINNWIIIACVSFIAGGFWASQEFNWGGWWNWDSLELGVLYLLIAYTTLIHVKSYFYKNIFYWGFIFYFLINYWILNKFGLTISIHSFIKNTVIYKYFKIIYIYINFLRFNLFVLCNFFLFNLLKPFISVIFYKILSIYFLIKINFFFKKYKNKSYHIIFYFIIFYFVLVNFFNITFYKNYYFLCKFLQLNIFFNKIKFLSNYNINILKKKFFFFKFTNSIYLEVNWVFFLKNFFSKNMWFLLF